MNSSILYESGLQPGVRVLPGLGEDILGGTRKTSYINQNETKEPPEPWTSSDLQNSLRFVPEVRCWHARNKLNHLINRSEPHW
jgi:hypothetical protein